MSALGVWGQKWLPRHAAAEDIDLDPLLVDMQRRVCFNALPKEPIVVRFEVQRNQARFMLLKAAEASICTQNPGFPEPLRVKSPLAALVGWWRGDMTFAGAQRMGLAIEGPRLLVRAFPTWFARYQFAHVAPIVLERERERRSARRR